MKTMFCLSLIREPLKHPFGIAFDAERSLNQYLKRDIERGR
jgi:hypothetical protein